MDNFQSAKSMLGQRLDELFKVESYVIPTRNAMLFNRYTVIAKDYAPTLANLEGHLQSATRNSERSDISAHTEAPEPHY